MSTYHPM